jgi:hypothetical protein
MLAVYFVAQVSEPTQRARQILVYYDILIGYKND